MSDEQQRQGAQVTLEMMGDVIEQRVMQHLAARFADMFEMELVCRDQQPYAYPSDGSHSVLLQVRMKHRYTNVTIQTQEKVLKLMPDNWGRPTLRAV